MINDVLHSELRSKREKMSLSTERMAHLLDISVESYWDLERTPPEWRMVLPFYKLRFAVALLEIDLAPVVGRVGEFGHFKEYTCTSDLVKSFRERSGLSKEEFSQVVGFETVFVDIVEQHPLGLELYPAEVAILVAQTLGIAPDEFLHWMMFR
jgi:DNA-binding XRE family transcriptional regulator